MNPSVPQSQDRPCGPVVASQRGGGGAVIRSVVGRAALLACAWSLSQPTGAGVAEEPAPAALPGAQSPAEAELTPSVLLDDLEAAARAKQARLERLRRQLLQLGEDSRRAASTAASPVVPAPPPEPAAHPPEDAGAASTADPTRQDLDAHLAPPQPSHGSDADPSGHAPASMPPDASDAAEFGEDDVPDAAIAHDPADGGDNEQLPQTTEAVVGTRINRLALADSLFATGQAELALQAYGSIQLTKLSAVDRYWIEYQIANCHRRLGNTAEAEQRYRALAGLVDGGWCATHARWWLDAISTRTKLQQELTQIRQTLHSVEEQLNAGPTP